MPAPLAYLRAKGSSYLYYAFPFLIQYTQNTCIKTETFSWQHLQWLRAGPLSGRV